MHPIQAAFEMFYRKPRKLADTDVDGYHVSTVETIDGMGRETAIANDEVGNYHPVERYDTDEEALAGHDRWVELVRSGTREVTDLGLPGFQQPFTVNLRIE
jgi:hypothetical protein